MGKKAFLIISALLLGLVYAFSATAEIEWHVEQTIKLKKKPIDTCLSVRGTYLFTLTNDGIIHAYDSEGNVKGEIFVGEHVDSIACGPNENVIILKSKKKKEVQTISFDFVEVINTEGSPFKGNADAPIVIAVFTDYQ